MTVLRTFSPLFLIWLGGTMVLDGSMSLGTMLAINALAAAFLQPVGSLVVSGQRLQLAGTHLERIADVMQAQPEQDANVVRPAPPLSGRIELRNVSFRYDSHSPNVLENVSLNIYPGQKVALVGRTGSGKSTLAKLLLGLYTPTEGEILYDGVPIHAMNLQSLRGHWGTVLQDVFPVQFIVARQHFLSTIRHCPYRTWCAPRGSPKSIQRYCGCPCSTKPELMREAQAYQVASASAWRSRARLRSSAPLAAG